MILTMTTANPWFVLPVAAKSHSAKQWWKTGKTEQNAELLSDEQLVASIVKNGGQFHFRMLVARYQSMVHAIALSVLGPAAQADAEDVAQEVFVKIYRQLEGFKGNSRFSTWLYRITVNLAIDHQRKQTRHRGEDLHEFTEPVTERHAELEHQKHELQVRLKTAVQKLEYRQRMMVHLFYWQGFRTREIAEVLDCPEGTVKVNLLRARKHLSLLLEGLDL